MERMEEIRQQLVESGVIGRVVDDFNPHLELIVCYGDKRVNLGDEVTLAEVQRHPTNLECDGDAFDPELEEIFANPELELVAMVSLIPILATMIYLSVFRQIEIHIIHFLRL